ncbi:alpha-amylase family protein [Cohnella faecalis]|uniref:alpha-amylase family protein n=1 Tax=Cohnella faecalis TaxID=2315694 RepID=UPI0018F569F0|nr:alpha-amylase family protein [Cohnella faecalis]
MSVNEVKFRQIHLDFHTSELIEGVGNDFDAERFAATLDEARVDSINLFVRCHHGMMYYDSKKFSERVHLHLKGRDILKQQAEACRKRGIHVNLYITVRWDVYSYTEHPEWVAIDAEGRYSDHEKRGYLEAGFYRNLCVNTGYRKFLKENLQEVMEEIPAEGVWFDASFVVECVCPSCLKGMKAAGLNPKNAEDRQRYAEDTYHEWVRDMSEQVRSFNPDYNIFYNKGHVGRVDKPVLDNYTYAAFESLPGGPWGYMDFPVSVKYIRTLGIETVGMTGRFHTSWGDNSSYRNKAALEFECYNMLAQGAKCSIGDQLEPSGVLSVPMYKRIGEVYAEVEKKEPWCRNVTAVTDIGVFTPEEFHGADTGNLPEASEGVCRLLQESGHQFDFIDSEADFSKYRLLILPDVIPVSDAFAQRLKQYLEEGGSVIASFESGLAPDKDSFALTEWGVIFKGNAPYSPDFVVPKGEVGKGLDQAEHVMYKQGAWVEASEGGEVLVDAVTSVFNRSFEHFSSHLHSPSSGKIGYPAIVKRGRVIYFIHPVFTQYHDNAPLWVKQMVRNAIDMLLPDPLLKHDGPSTVIATVNRQEEEARQVVHLLHYIPERRSKVMDIVEDVIPLYDTAISVREDRPVKSVSLVPGTFR